MILYVCIFLLVCVAGWLPAGFAHYRGGGERASLSGWNSSWLHQEAERLPSADGRLEGFSFTDCVSHSAAVAEGTLAPKSPAAGVRTLVCFSSQVQSGDEFVDQPHQLGLGSSLVAPVPRCCRLSEEVLQADPPRLAVSSDSGTHVGLSSTVHRLSFINDKLCLLMWIRFVNLHGTDLDWPLEWQSTDFYWFYMEYFNGSICVSFNYYFKN